MKDAQPSLGNRCPPAAARPPCARRAPAIRAPSAHRLPAQAPWGPWAQHKHRGSSEAPSANKSVMKLADYRSFNKTLIKPEEASPER